MEKLYDLMTMGVKYQFLCCNCPQQIMQVTLNHLHAMRQISADSDVDELITNIYEQVIENYCNLANGDWQLLKQQMFQFFQGRKIKVSLFLQANLQHMNGTLVLLHSGPVANNTEVPGKITYFDKHGNSIKTSEFEALQGQGNCEPACKTFFDPNFYLGLNIYLNDKKEMKEELKKYWDEDDQVKEIADIMSTQMNTSTSPKKNERDSMSPGGAASPGLSMKSETKDDSSPFLQDEEPRRKRSVARPRRGSINELNMLASLMGAAVETTEEENANSEQKEEYKPIKMNFDSYFGNFGGSGGRADSDVEENLITTQKIDGTKKRMSIDERFASLGMNLEMAEAKNDEGDGDDDEKASGSDDDSDDDLLAMLDEAK